MKTRRTWSFFSENIAFAKAGPLSLPTMQLRCKRRRCKRSLRPSGRTKSTLPPLTSRRFALGTANELLYRCKAGILCPRESTDERDRGQMAWVMHDRPLKPARPLTERPSLLAPLRTMATAPTDIAVLMKMNKRPSRRWAVRCRARKVGLSCSGAITDHSPAGRMCMKRPAVKFAHIRDGGGGWRTHRGTRGLLGVDAVLNSCWGFAPLPSA